MVVRVAPGRLHGYVGPQFYHPRRAKALLVIEQSGLKTRRLRDLADRVVDRITADSMRKRGLAYVGLAQIDPQNGIISDRCEEETAGYLRVLQAGGILFSKLRPYLNQVAICPQHMSTGAGSTELVTYRPTRGGVDPHYLVFVLRSLLVLNQVIDITSGLTHPRVDPELIDDVLVPLLSDDDMTSIGESVREATRLAYPAASQVAEAKSDIEAFIEGTIPKGSCLGR